MIIDARVGDNRRTPIPSRAPGFGAFLFPYRLAQRRIGAAAPALRAGDTYALIAPSEREPRGSMNAVGSVCHRRVGSFASAMRICSFKRSAAEIATLLPFPPSRLVERGPDQKKEPKDSRWILDSPLPDTVSVEEHIQYFVNLLETNSKGLRNLPRDCEIDIWCTISSTTEFNGFSLDRTLLKRLTTANVELIFGVY